MRHPLNLCHLGASNIFKAFVHINFYCSFDLIRRCFKDVLTDGNFHCCCDGDFFGIYFRFKKTYQSFLASVLATCEDSKQQVSIYSSPKKQIKVSFKLVSCVKNSVYKTAYDKCYHEYIPNPVWHFITFFQSVI